MTDHALDSWKDKVPLLSQKPVADVEKAVCRRRRLASVFPAEENVFRALSLTPFDQVKVVILGQDPYHGKGQADGLAFSVPDGVRIPPSLRNIFKEVARDTGRPLDEASSDLSRWARQGVLLLNAVLTVEEGKAASHANLGWKGITDGLVHALSAGRSGLVFMLWGGYARGKKHLIDEAKHRILEAPHPSPLSAHRGFMGCGHFSEANRFLAQQGKTPVSW
ncbi:uracil-DNA glycosylase [Desulfoluna butyratoxydans]|uniref:Uracil-DNA glycosylase n=1 Tax=Desulfoluna butyratoxydans TaxID=231438 RepID=A0A4V6YUC1_9BACT|nr:uracil-DNA glycosylase [Desulfoluna butyratoxydans]VFQ43228.1 ung: uracil-dna glycosylase [Desulfoluna butyratoxydans]